MNSIAIPQGDRLQIFLITILLLNAIGNWKWNTWCYMELIGQKYRNTNEEFMR